MGKAVKIYDTTLRDGAQGEGINFSLKDKLDITRELDEHGIHYIEGGWPGANVKDTEYFREVRRVKLKNARVAAFGSTHHPKRTASTDPVLQNLIESKAPIFTIVGKASDRAVKEALRIAPEENLRLIRSSVRHLKNHAEEVFFDAEHFFDGYRSAPEYSLKALEAAAEAGASGLILCDTNGGTLPHLINEITRKVAADFSGVTVGIHAHNDSGMAVANSIEAVLAGATQVQGTINGFGERTGNADLLQIIPNLELKLGISCIGGENLKRLTHLSRVVYQIANALPRADQPFVGRSAFAHKAGLHASAVSRNPSTYEHVPPESVGNERRILVSELSGRSNILACARTDLKADPETTKKLVDKIAELENEGYTFENADASFHLLVSKTMGHYRPCFELKNARLISEFTMDGRRVSEATVKCSVNGVEYHTVSEGEHGPVNALDAALRKALMPIYRQLADMRLVDYKVHIVNASAASAAKVRVVITSADKDEVWGTVGVSENIIEASCQALVDSFQYKLAKESRN